MFFDFLIVPGLLALLFVAQEVGFRAGLRTRAAAEAEAGTTGQVGAVQGALLGLLGLLLGFSFAGAASRFLERQDLITREANAIGTAYLRADMLVDPHKAALKAALRDYTAHRIEASKQFRYGLSSEVRAEIDVMHGRMWAAARDGVTANPSLAMVVLPPVNDVIDIHSLRVAAGSKHLPAQIMGMLIGCSVIAMSVMGYGAGLAGRRASLLLAALILLIGTALWTTIDFDHPRAGLLKLSEAPLKSLRFD